MLFHTWPFLGFLSIVLPVFFALRKTWLWLPWLTVASYFFCGWRNPYYLFLVLYSTTLDFFLVVLMDRCPHAGEKVDVARRLTRLRFDDGVLTVAFVVCVLAALVSLSLALAGPRTLRPMMAVLGVIVLLMALGAFYGSRRMWLAISVANNLALLLFFKYARFVVGNLNAVFTGLHLPDPSTLMPSGWSYVLPAGISFFTFQSLSYTIDFYLGKVRRERNFLRFATFVCFFPQLMAGPIERARHLLPQFRQFPQIRLQNFTDGASLFLVGLFKKLALANYLSLYVERVYDNPKAERAGADARHDCVRLAGVFRFQRLHGHGPRCREADGVQFDSEFQQPLSRHQPERILVALAHQPVHVVPRLRVHQVLQVADRVWSVLSSTSPWEFLPGGFLQFPFLDCP